MANHRPKQANDVNLPLMGAVPHNPEQTDPLFWSSLEGALNKTTDEVEAIALDWLYEILTLAIRRTEIHILGPDEQVYRNLFSDLIRKEPGCTIHHPSVLFEKPANIEGVYQAIRRNTGLTKQDCLSLARKILRIVISYARVNCQIIYERYGSKPSLHRITDQRLPFPCLQPKELQSRPMWD